MPLSLSFVTYFARAVILCSPVVLGASLPGRVPIADLGYATYQGTSLPNGVNQFLGMRYAAPPTGDLRFKLPVPPPMEAGIKRAEAHGPLCYGVSSSDYIPPSANYSEDCLFVDVYAPANASAQARKGEGLPVMVWIQGGGYALLYNPNYNGTGLIEASNSNMIVVSFNYRVGPYGFLASEELQSEGNLNVGLHDQRAAVRWCQQNIAKFGGDPEKISLFGVSAGSGSVLLQLLAYGGSPPAGDNVTWRAGLASSVYLPAVYPVKTVEFQYQYLLNATGCTSLSCLRALPTAKFQAANVPIPFPGQQEAPLFGYAPVLDDLLIPDSPQNLLSQGRYSRDKPLILGSSHSEGTIFTPAVNTTAELSTFLRAQLPQLNQTDLDTIENLYSNTPTRLPGVNVTEAPLYYRAAEAYGDASFSCQSLIFAKGLSDHGTTVFLYRDHIVDPVEYAAGYIVPHTEDLLAIWGPKYATQYSALPGANSYDAGGVNAPIVPVVQAYWTNFATTGGDPNTRAARNTTTWTNFADGNYRLKLQTNDTKLEVIGEDERRKCAFWNDVYPSIEH